MNETASGTADDIQLRENQVLTLEMVLQDLVADGLLDKEQATEMRVTNQHRRGPRIHPLVLVGNQNYRARREPRRCRPISTAGVETMTDCPPASCRMLRPAA